MNPLVSIIIVSYNSRKYIEKCIDSVLAQKYKDWDLMVVINGSNDGSREIVREKYGRYKRIEILEPGENLWFARGNNFAFEKAKGNYIFALNQDTVLEPEYIKMLVAEMERDKYLGSISGKLYHYNFSIDSKTRILDSTGIEMFRTRRVIDRGQWEADSGQYDHDLEIFGVTGAAGMYRRAALEEVKIPKKEGGYEYFDEDFIAYKEDIDLSWRLQLAGYRCRYLPNATMHHGRTVGRSWPTQFIRFILNRRRQSRLNRRLAFKNHYLMMVKNELPEILRRDIIYILLREFLLLFYTIFFEPFQILAVIDLFKQLPEARRKRRIIMSRVKADPDHLIKLFH